MSAWIFIIGLLLLWAGVSSRLARRERRSLELAALNYPIKVAAFWGRDGKAEPAFGWRTREKGQGPRRAH